MEKTHFERALFLSWYCSKADCTFCYMSTQKDKIKLKNPKLARRRVESVYAEALICKKLGWAIEFISGGYESFTIDELVEITKNVNNITGEKQWLNIGTLSFEELKKFKPYVEGFSAPIECINPKLHKKVCPSKSLEEANQNLEYCDKLNLKKSVTIIVGLGETEKDIPLLLEYIKKHKLDRITFYALNPHEGTEFYVGPTTDYYVKWIKAIRKEFPKLEIIAGSWVDRLNEISSLLDAGADYITKFPSIKLFNSKFAKEIEKQASLAGRDFQGSLTKLPDVDWDLEVDNLDIADNTKEIVKKKVQQYIKQMKKNK